MLLMIIRTHFSVPKVHMMTSQKHSIKWLVENSYMIRHCFVLLPPVKKLYIFLGLFFVCLLVGLPTKLEMNFHGSLGFHYLFLGNKIS